MKKQDTAAARASAGQHAVAVDPAIKDANLKRLRRIEGQVRGLQKMVEEDRYCPDIITQIASVQEALRGVGRQLLRNHLKHCAATAIKKGPADADRTYDELLELDLQTLALKYEGNLIVVIRYFNRSIAVTNLGSMSTGTDVSLSSTALASGRSTPSVSIICLAFA